MVEVAERSNPEKPTSDGSERPTVEVTVTMTCVPRELSGAGLLT
jgi:hypothetical protein